MIFSHKYIKRGDKVQFNNFYKEGNKMVKSKLIGRVEEIFQDTYENYILRISSDRTYYVDECNILRTYSSFSNPLTHFKHLWKDLHFRQIKAVKGRNIIRVEYRYINKDGFHRTRVFNTLEEALNEVEPTYHDNIEVIYDDYYGFSTYESLRSNDKYPFREIFFSKKCYCELDFGAIPGIFNNRSIKYRGTIPPIEGQYICGLIEHGEKGLFYRKWFVCSKEFLTLWTMVCDPHNQSLSSAGEPLTFTQLLPLLSTSHYQVDYTRPIDQTKREYVSSENNYEMAALYSPDIYQKLAKLIFDKGKTYNVI